LNLPDLKTYRSEFEKKGVVYPLKPVDTIKTGLLKTLPPPPAGKKGWAWTEETDPAIYNNRESWPKLTIVTPSYNQGAFLEETIRSILLQNYPNLEYIVMDGGSNDSSKAILEKYSPWISYWQSEKDGGQGQAINLGFSLASGDYYAWINSDDYYLKDVFHLVMNTFLASKTSFVYGYVNNFYVDKNEFVTVKLLPFTDYFIKIPALSQPSCFWSAKIHQPIWEELYCSMDFELWLRLVKGQKRKLLKQPLSVAQAHDDAKTHDPKMKEKWDADHQKIWSAEAHGTVHEWNRIVFLNSIRKKIYKWFGWID
jgi:glycosyltransferase involved in cell wall biosynthesis